MKSARGSRELLLCVSLLPVVAVAKSQVLPCAAGVNNRTISNSAQAVDLTEVLFCSGGQFEVNWVGEVLLSRTIAVSDGTSLKVSGSSSGGSVIDGGGTYQLFNVSEGATLELQGLLLVNGASSSAGGAIALSGSSSLEVRNCSFEFNNATAGDGGKNASGSSVRSRCGIVSKNAACCVLCTVLQARAHRSIHSQKR